MSTTERLTPSERLDELLCIAPYPGEPELPLSAFVVGVARIARQKYPSIRERAADTWRWKRQIGPALERRRWN